MMLASPTAGSRGTISIVVGSALPREACWHYLVSKPAVCILVLVSCHKALLLWLFHHSMNGVSSKRWCRSLILDCDSLPWEELASRKHAGVPACRVATFGAIRGPWQGIESRISCSARFRGMELYRIFIKVSHCRTRLEWASWRMDSTHHLSVQCLHSNSVSLVICQDQLIDPINWSCSRVVSRDHWRLSRMPIKRRCTCSLLRARALSLHCLTIRLFWLDAFNELVLSQSGICI